jgi:hypothetical protein
MAQMSQAEIKQLVRQGKENKGLRRWVVLETHGLSTLRRLYVGDQEIGYDCVSLSPATEGQATVRQVIGAFDRPVAYGTARKFMMADKTKVAAA